MIFTSQLGDLSERTNSEAIKNIANHVRKMQEELEYRLSVLDSSNISEIDASQVPIVTKDGNILSLIKDGNEKYSQLEHTVDGLNSKIVQYGNEVDGYKNDVAGYEKQVSSFEQTVKGFNTTVASYGDTVASYGDKVTGYEDEVKAYKEQVSTFNQTVDGFETTVAKYEAAVEGYSEQVSAYEQTVNGFQSSVQNYGKTVDGYTQQVSHFEQTANSISLKVEEVEDENGKVTAASIAAKIKDDASLIEIIANNVKITGVTTLTSTSEENNKLEIDGAEMALVVGSRTAGGIYGAASDKYDDDDGEVDLTQQPVQRPNTGIDRKVVMYGFDGVEISAPIVALRSATTSAPHGYFFNKAIQHDENSAREAFVISAISQNRDMCLVGKVITMWFSDTFFMAFSEDGIYTYAYNEITEEWEAAQQVRWTSA